MAATCAAPAQSELSASLPELDQMRWTIDYPEDLAFLRAVHDALPIDIVDARMSDVLTVLVENPRIAAINAMRHQKSPEKSR